MVLVVILISAVLLLWIAYKLFIKIYGAHIDNPYKHVSKMTQLDWLYTLGIRNYCRAILSELLEQKKKR